MKEKKEGLYSILAAVSFHVILILLLANILIIKPSARKAFFQAKIVSTKDVNIQQLRPKREMEMAEELKAVPAKDIIIPEAKPLVVDKELELPALAKTPEVKVGELKGREPEELTLKRPTGKMLDFSSKAKITGSGKGIKGTFVFPISTYSDWDNDPTTIPNLVNEVGRRTNIKVSVQERPIDFRNKNELFQYPMIYINGHQDFSFSPQEIENIREYLKRGGFLFAVNDTARGGAFHDAFQREMKEIFPEQKLQKLPMAHPIYHIFYDFKGNQLPDALYKDLSPEGYAIYYEDRMVVFYLATGDACDAWAEAEGSKWPGTYYTPTASHMFKKLSQSPGVPGKIHAGAGDEGIENAFKIGVNVVVYALSSTE